ncbi:PRC-barrel domain-containing protein [Halomonas sp. Bachu 37]|uniref:PRC-barrel domain-containing protein n=1 Tax=Halomonas kashgarensis TaxID=3084920 RepID=UPI00321656F1
MDIMRKTTLTLAIAALAGGYTLSSHATDSVRGSHEPQGLYSADDLMDADVYYADAAVGDDEIGEVDDILLDDDMKVSALVIESDDILGLGGREIVVEAQYFRLETQTEDDGDTEHRILIDATAEEMEGFPTYDRDWWEQTKQNASEAWNSTQQGAESAWQNTREALRND